MYKYTYKYMYKFYQNIAILIKIDSYYFNNINPNIQFTYEIEKDNNINFLDLLLINNDNKIITNWFQKSCFSGRFLNYNSYHPRSHKICIIYNLVDRAIQLSDMRFHNKTIKFCKNLLLLNDYTTKFFNKYVKKGYILSNKSTTTISFIFCFVLRRKWRNALRILCSIRTDSYVELALPRHFH